MNFFSDDIAPDFKLPTVNFLNNMNTVLLGKKLRKKNCTCNLHFSLTALSLSKLPYSYLSTVEPPRVIHY